MKKHPPSDTHGFPEAYRHYREVLIIYCRQRLSQAGSKDLTADAEDIAADTFECLLENLHQIQSPTHLRRFLFMTAQNRIVDKIRNQKVRQKFLVHVQWVNSQPDENRGTEWQLHRKMVRKEFQKRMKILPDKCQKVLTLYMEEKSIKEIAINLGIDHKTVYAHLKTGKKKIKQLMLGVSS